MYRVFDGKNISRIQLPPNSSQINFSMLREFYAKFDFRSFSIKYVLEGCERYTVNGKAYDIGAGQYLLGNAFCKGQVEVDSKSVVKGVCIDVAPAVIAEVTASHLEPESSAPDLGLEKFFNTPEFLENKYHAGNTHLGRYLETLGKELSANPFVLREFNNEFYYTLAEKIVADHLGIVQRLNNIQALRSSTRKDLYRKLERGKTYMDDSYATPLNIGTVASEAAMSEYHFFRMFKTVYGMTPNQYLLKKRLEKAYQLLEKGHGPVSFVAVQAGFPDIFGFSRTFKKHYGISPSKVFVRD